jgi:hypothetical protein
MKIETAPRELLVRFIFQPREFILQLQNENKLLKQQLEKLQATFLSISSLALKGN